MCALSMLAAACTSYGPGSPDQHEALDRATRDYQSCVRAALSRLVPKTQAHVAVVRSLDASCRAQRQAVATALAPFGSGFADDYNAELNAWVTTEARLIMSEVR